MSLAAPDVPEGEVGMVTCWGVISWAIAAKETSTVWPISLSIGNILLCSETVNMVSFSLETTTQKGTNYTKYALFKTWQISSVTDLLASYSLQTVLRLNRQWGRLELAHYWADSIVLILTDRKLGDNLLINGSYGSFIFSGPLCLMLLNFCLTTR